MRSTLLLLALFYSISNFSQSIDNKQDDKIYDLVGLDVRPEFPGGLEKLNSYLSETGFETNEKADAKTIAMFIVEKDGAIRDVKIYGKASSDAKERLIETLTSLPAWIPGKINGGIIRVLYTLPLFRK